jgi:DNA-binding Lrp family transcriptional regulator
MSFKLDEKDQKIIEILKENSDFTTRQIAKKTLLPITTVHHRINKLKAEGVIRKFTIEIDERKLGKNFAAHVLVSCDYKTLRGEKRNQHILAKDILRFPEVERVDIVAGGSDMILRVRTTDVEAYDTFLFNRLQKLNGIDKTQTLVIIHEG